MARMPAVPIATLALPLALLLASHALAQAVQHPGIDMPGFLVDTVEAASHRAARLVSEQEFARMSREPGTVILDARSRDKYDELHVRGAVHLSFPDITVESLGRLLPGRSTRILIYCNNNFTGAEGPFPTKIPRASLNLSTYVALYSYGYRNVHELATTTELAKSVLDFEIGDSTHR
jgi:hypothetical protein